MQSSDFPTPEEAKRHWQRQDPSVFAPPGRRDPGQSIVNSKDEVEELVETELQGAPVALFRSKNPATIYADPVGDAQKLIQEYHRKGLSEDEFAKRVKSPAEHLLYLILYGKMTDSQRAGHVTKLAKLLFEEQKRQEDLLHREKQLEEKKVANLLKAGKLQQQMLEREKRKQAELTKANAPEGEVDDVH